MTTSTAKLSFGNQSAEFPIKSPILGKDSINIKTLGKAGIYTLDVGFIQLPLVNPKLLLSMVNKVFYCIEVTPLIN